MDRSRRAFRRWHKRLGLFAAAFLALLAISGVMLNHSDAFSIARYQVKAPWLARWYGIKATAPTDGYVLRSGQLIADADTWILNGRPVASHAGLPVGTAEVGPLVAVATDSAIYLFLQDGTRVEKLSSEALPSTPIKAIGAASAQLVIDTAAGLFASTDGSEWRPFSGSVSWSRRIVLSAAQRADVRAYFEPALDAMKVLQDLHSGRIVGRYGPLLWDVVAAVILVLSFSGLLIAYLSRRR